MILAFLAAWLALLFYLGFAFRPWRDLLSRLRGRVGEWAVAVLLLPYLLAVNLRPAPVDLLRMVLYLAVPTLCLRLRRRATKPFDLLHVLAILGLWVPIESSLFILLLELVAPGLQLSKLLAGFYFLPGTSAPLVPGFALPIDKLTAILLGLYLFTVAHPLPELGFTFRWRLRDLQDGGIGWLAYAVVGLPLGLALGFLRLNPASMPPGRVALGLLAGYLFTALPEELLFRGIIQNLLAQRLRTRWVGLAIAALVFGLSHLNNSTTGFPVPNWAYALMATLAGLAYGWVWQRSQKVTVSALTHASVNAVWGALFHA